jgi:hypothetical protein
VCCKRRGSVTLRMGKYRINVQRLRRTRQRCDQHRGSTWRVYRAMQIAHVPIAMLLPPRWCPFVDEVSDPARGKGGSHPTTLTECTVQCDAGYG